MRVLLLGATGNLGSRCLQALIAHKHTVTVVVRNVPKLQSMMSPVLLGQIHAIVEGDATDSAALEKAILDYDIEGIIDVAGNVVPPWQESVMPKIARAVTHAAVAVGKQRGKPLRAWISSGIVSLEYPGTGYLFSDYMPKTGVNQHTGVRDVVEAIPLSKLKWSLYGSAGMYSNRKQGQFEPLDAPIPHDLLVKANSPPGWEKTWVERIPLIGVYLNPLYMILVHYQTRYEAVADFLAKDLEKEDSEWIGKKVGVKEKSKKDV